MNIKGVKERLGGQRLDVRGAKVSHRWKVTPREDANLPQGVQGFGKFPRGLVYVRSIRGRWIT